MKRRKEGGRRRKKDEEKGKDEKKRGGGRGGRRREEEGKEEGEGETKRMEVWMVRGRRGREERRTSNSAMENIPAIIVV